LILSSLEQIIFSEKFKDTFRTQNSFFVRSRLFTFSTIILMQLNFISRSISVEVSKFLSKFHFSGKEKDGSKQAFSKARQHIKWEGFVHLNEELVKQYYDGQDQLHYKNKYIVLATDGSTYQLPYEKRLIDEFNTCDNGQGQPMCMAQGVKIYDVLNHINIISTLSPYNSGQSKGTNEQVLFEECLEKLPQLIDNKEHNILILGDRFYPSYFNFHELSLLEYSFVFRVKATFCNEIKDFVKSKEVDSWLEIDLNKNGRKYSTSAKRIKEMPSIIRVRCVKIILKSGEVEYLITNLDEDELSRQDSKKLYNFRWNEETSFDTDKNKLEVENISSKTPNGVRQDFHAKVLSANITQLLISDAQQMLDEEQADKDNKYDYQINRAVATGLVKDELPKLFLGKEPAETWYPRMVKKIFRRREPIRPGRTYHRKRKHKLKYPITKRRVI